MSGSVRSRTFVAIISLIILAFLAGIILSFTFANRYYISVKQKEMLEVYDSISYLYDSEYIDEYELGSMHISDAVRENKEGLADVCDKFSISLLIIDPSGNAVFNYGNANIMSSRLNDLTLKRQTDYEPFILESSGEYIIQTISKEDKSNIEFLEMWGILKSQNSFIARSSFSGIQNSIQGSVGFFSFVLMIVLLIAAVIIFILLNSYSKPLKALVRATENAGNMDFTNVNYKSKRKDEIGILGENITEMSQKLEKAVSELKSSNLKLSNELKAKSELEEQRKKYISDISHELKTPIALISGYAEGLKEGIGGSKEDQDYYLDVIVDEAEKMNLMVKRISSLNKLEQGQGEVDLQRFNVVEAINGYLNTMAIIFDEKGVDIYFNDKDIIYVWSDEFLFEEVLMNYINNALNHVDDKKTISIKVEPLEECARVTVFNSGKQIPAEDIEKIWGEFYKVDKARTREYGGSGLGLSIVKAISETLNQKCGVYNTENGPAFWIDLELDKVQAYGNKELAKKSYVRLSDLPIWKTTTKILKDTSDRIEAQANERAEKEAARKEERAKKEAKKKEDKIIKQNQKKEEQFRQKNETIKIIGTKKIKKDFDKGIKKDANDK